MCERNEFIMKDKKTISIVLGFMCVALTAGIFIQIRTVENSNYAVSQSYQENNLRSEVLKYKEKYDNRYNDLERVQQELENERKKSTQNDGELEKEEEQIKVGNKIIGLSEVNGPGVIITLTDSKKDATNVLDPSSLLVHDADVLAIINELKNAGAEAICINDQRIVPTSGIICGGNIIQINGEKVGAPFVIKAIGLPEQLMGALTRQNGYIDILKKASVEVDLKKTNSINIPKYTGVLTYKYAETIE